MKAIAGCGRGAPLVVVLSACLMVLSVEPALGQSGFEISMYSGSQGASDTRITGTDETGAPFDFMASWEGRSFEMLFYYGVKIMRWQEDGWGYGLQITHNKVWADDETLLSSGFSTLNFTDGNNVATLDLARRGDISDHWKVHLGVGLGFVMPHLEVRTPAGVLTDEYQITGLAGRWYGGLEYGLGRHWSVFGEYAGSLSLHRAHLEEGGTLNADIVTHAINGGITYVL